jgi:kinesin family protein C1
MSQLPQPTPSSAARAPGSRLPAPSSVPRLTTKKPSGSNLMAPPAAPAGPAKRTRGSIDLEDGVAAAQQQQAAKRSRTAATTATQGSLSKAKSMMSINRGGQTGGAKRGGGGGGGGTMASSAAARVARPLPGSMMTGRATMATVATAAGGRKAPVGSKAFSDRTNLTGATRGGGVSKAKGVPAWDLKGKIELMASQLASTNDRVAVLESQNDALKTNVEEKETVVAMNTQELDQMKSENDRLLEEAQELKKELATLKDQTEEEARTLKRRLEELEFDKSTLERRVKALDDDLSTKMEENRGLKTTVAQLTAASAGTEAELKANKKLLEAERERTAELTQLTSRQSADIEAHEERARAFETERRRLHNTIQELKVKRSENLL